MMTGQGICLANGFLQERFVLVRLWFPGFPLFSSPTGSFFPKKKKKRNSFCGTLDEAMALSQTAWTDGAERSVWPITLLVV